MEERGIRIPRETTVHISPHRSYARILQYFVEPVGYNQEFALPQLHSVARSCGCSARSRPLPGRRDPLEDSTIRHDRSRIV